MTFLNKKLSQGTGLTYWTNTPPDSPKRIILYLAGWGCAGTDVSALAKCLDRLSHNTYFFLAPDQPGHGDSPPSTCPEPTIAGFARVLHALCDEVLASVEYGGELVKSEMVVMGHSMGCRTALEFFSQRPERIVSIVLLDGNWHGVKEVDTTPPPKGIWPVEAAVQGMESSFGVHTPEAFKEQQRQLCHKIDLDYLILAMISNRVWDAQRMVPVLEQATDGASGPRKPMQRGQESVWMRAAKEHAGAAYSGIVVEESGHWPHVDQTEEVVEAVLPLLS